MVGWSTNVDEKQNCGHHLESTAYPLHIFLEPSPWNWGSSCFEKMPGRARRDKEPWCYSRSHLSPDLASALRGVVPRTPASGLHHPHAQNTQYGHLFETLVKPREDQNGQRNWVTLPGLGESSPTRLLATAFHGSSLSSFWNPPTLLFIQNCHAFLSGASTPGALGSEDSNLLPSFYRQGSEAEGGGWAAQPHNAGVRVSSLAHGCLLDIRVTLIS